MCFLYNKKTTVNILYVDVVQQRSLIKTLFVWSEINLFYLLRDVVYER